MNSVMVSVCMHSQCLCSVHSDLTLDGFKRIFYTEYTHRMWGRLTGLVIMLPAAYFWVRGRLGPALKPRVGVYIGLVVAQVIMFNFVIIVSLLQGTFYRSLSLSTLPSVGPSWLVDGEEWFGREG